MKEFGETDQVIGSFSIVIWILGFAVGPLFLGYACPYVLRPAYS